MEAFSADGEWWSIGLPEAVPDRLMEGRTEVGLSGTRAPTTDNTEVLQPHGASSPKKCKPPSTSWLLGAHGLEGRTPTSLRQEKGNGSLMIMDPAFLTSAPGQTSPDCDREGLC